MSGSNSPAINAGVLLTRRRSAASEHRRRRPAELESGRGTTVCVTRLLRAHRLPHSDLPIVTAKLQSFSSAKGAAFLRSCACTHTTLTLGESQSPRPARWLSSFSAFVWWLLRPADRRLLLLGKHRDPVPCCTLVCFPSSRDGPSTPAPSPCNLCSSWGSSRRAGMAAEGLHWGSATRTHSTASDCFGLDQRCGSGMSLSRWGRAGGQRCGGEAPAAAADLRG